MTDFLFGGMVQSNTPINISSAIVADNISVTGSTLPTNGLYLSAANTLAFATNGTQRMVINSSGQVGIGTAAPGVTFDLIGNTGAVAAPTYLNQTSFAFRNNFHTRMAMVNPGSPYVSQLSSYTAGAAFPTTTLTFGTSSTFLFENGDGTVATTEKMRITSTGNVGIGSSTPQQTLDVSGNVNVLNTVIMGSSFLRNKVINGEMSVAQRGTSYALTSSVAYGSLDRWAALQITTASGTFSQIASGLTSFQYAAKLQRTASTTNTGSLWMGQAFETVNSIPLQGKTVTFSFWAKAGANFSGSTNLMQAQVITGTGTDQSISSMFSGTWTGYASAALNQAITTTWTRYSYTVAIGSSVTQIGVILLFTPTGTAGADDSMSITGAQLEEGPVATPFERKLYDQVLVDCQRYYLLIGDGTLIASGYLTSGSYLDAMVRWPVTMRASPVVAVNGTWNVSGNNGQPTVSLSGASGASLRVTATATGQVYATVSGGSGTPTLSANAEL